MRIVETKKTYKAGLVPSYRSFSMKTVHSNYRRWFILEICGEQAVDRGYHDWLSLIYAYVSRILQIFRLMLYTSCVLFDYFSRIKIDSALSQKFFVKSQRISRTCGLHTSNPVGKIILYWTAGFEFSLKIFDPWIRIRKMGFKSRHRNERRAVILHCFNPLQVSFMLLLKSSC